MPNYTIVRTRISGYSKAAALLPHLQAIHQQCKAVSGVIALYQSGTDADFNAAVNAIFTTGERAELVDMLTQITALITAWDAAHAPLLAASPEQ